MDQNIYVDILDKVMLPYTEFQMPLLWVFQQDNDPNHTNKKAKKWFEEKKVNIMEWLAQSLDLNPIENLWADFKIAVAVTKLTSNQAFWNVVKESWNKIPLNPCQELVNSMPRRSEAVIDKKATQPNTILLFYLQH